MLFQKILISAQVVRQGVRKIYFLLLKRVGGWDKKLYSITAFVNTIQS